MFDLIRLKVFGDGDFSIPDENKRSLGTDQCISGQAGLFSTHPNQKPGEKSENNSENRDDSISDLAFAYELLPPLSIFIGALACTIVRYEMQVRKESIVGAILGFGGPISLLIGLWWWVLW